MRCFYLTLIGSYQGFTPEQIISVHCYIYCCHWSNVITVQTKSWYHCEHTLHGVTSRSDIFQGPMMEFTRCDGFRWKLFSVESSYRMRRLGRQERKLTKNTEDLISIVTTLEYGIQLFKQIHHTKLYLSKPEKFHYTMLRVLYRACISIKLQSIRVENVIDQIFYQLLGPRLIHLGRDKMAII